MKKLSILCVLLLIAGFTGCGDGSGSSSTRQSNGTSTTVQKNGLVKQVKVFGIPVKATAKVSDEKLLHAARVMAEYLDNDENGTPDNQDVIEAMLGNNAVLIMFGDENEINDVFKNEDEFPENGQDLYAAETHPEGSQNGDFDATLEEVLHLITHTGYTSLYPSVFGEEKGSSVANAMDLARGGSFDLPPVDYPSDAWYTYDDETCDYSCQVTESVYWAMTSILGAQEYQGRLEEIEHEWKLNTKEKIETSDPAIYTILTNPDYKLPETLPDGTYVGVELFITQLTPSMRNQGVFKVLAGDRIVEMNGTIGSSSLNDFNSLLSTFPEVDTINIKKCDGSEDDQVNLQLSSRVNKLGINTHLLSGGLIASGGVDFFLAGVERSKGANTKIGVHSWSDGGSVEATDFPVGHAYHLPYINYYVSVGFTQQEAEDFYYFTINAAPASEIHWMTDTEIQTYNIVNTTPEPNQPDLSLNIKTVPVSLGKNYTDNFNRYTKITAPNGKAIHIVAQDKISNDQIVRVRNVLQHYLTNLPGSEYGADKSNVANKMADNNATLLLQNGSDDGSNNIEVDGQPLFENEIQVEGHSWYVNQNYEHRDATFEEVLHLVHDYGIGVDGPNASPGALPSFQSEIRAAQQNALANNLWGIGEAQWLAELADENSLSQEYLASVVDSFYGLWGAFTENTTNGMWGLYIAKTRDEMTAEDPMGTSLMSNKFFHSYLTYNARIDPNFQGIFVLSYDEDLPYTNHSQYLKDVTLTGSIDSNVKVNHYDNNITGNSGINTVIFSGESSEYTITKSSSTITVADITANRDGINTLKNIEKIEFTDQIIEGE